MGRRFSSEKLVQLRGRKTQTDLAYALRSRGFGTTQTTVSRWESGQEPRAQVLPALAAELGVTVDALYTDDDEEAASMEPLARDLAEMFAQAVARALEARLGKQGVRS